MPTTIFVDGIFDLFHRGHLETIKQIKNDADVFLVVGVISDQDTIAYKKNAPIINEDDRFEIIQSLRCVDLALKGTPLHMTTDFLEEHNIDLVVHSFKDDEDWEKQKEFFDHLGDKFKRVSYYSSISTSQIISQILHRRP